MGLVNSKYFCHLQRVVCISILNTRFSELIRGAHKVAYQNKSETWKLEKVCWGNKSMFLMRVDYTEKRLLERCHHLKRKRGSGKELVAWQAAWFSTLPVWGNKKKISFLNEKKKAIYPEESHTHISWSLEYWRLELLKIKRRKSIVSTAALGLYLFSHSWTKWSSLHIARSLPVNCLWLPLGHACKKLKVFYEILYVWACINWGFHLRNICT